MYIYSDDCHIIMTYYRSQISISEINECNSVPCQNGGQCIDEINKYSCLCEAGFTGLNCETGNLSL